MALENADDVQNAQAEILHFYVAGLLDFLADTPQRQGV
jgi:hypothetical protein